MDPILVLWVYIALLVVGGIIGFLKAKSKVSLQASLIAAVALILHPLGILRATVYPDIIITMLLLFFGIRFAKTKKFMPAGLMAIASLVAIVLRNLHTF
jgi:uncharacterized membrane protein (UPF0136 family)